MSKVAILGIGLIGGSLALCIKERTDWVVSGYDTSEESLALATSAGMIDRGYTHLAEAIADADILVLAVPVNAAKELLNQVAMLPLKEGCIITDVGSTKGEIVAHARELKGLPATFIGGHPMAGSHHSGVQASHSLLFENAYYVLTPLPNTPLADVERLSRLLTIATRAKLVMMDPRYHDEVVGAISHLPHIIASGLVNQISRYNEQNEWYYRLAAGGFRDLTRIAAAHPIMWRDILLSNREAILPLMDDWIAEMSNARKAILDADADQIESFFTRAKISREGLPERVQGVLQSSYECYVDVPDSPGMIAGVAQLLADEKINLQNIGVMENREDRAGVLRLVFGDSDQQQRARDVLKRKKFRVFDLD
ncbi:prephenate dehydrogenase [Marininema halotolerans]|uniref:Prephenate dehydrogenase n=1 Tax=Marininema halotolerans TaxID=1155944 RepID=A0A1I6TZN9_9BACL|nr:prephenate dehydrogenase [Marininema halotolerans]SFS94614.1 prephenate dehydrogenase [Marininema halotolerans]